MVFNPAAYLAAHADVAAAGVNPFVHHPALGRDEGRSLTPLLVSDAHASAPPAAPPAAAEAQPARPPVREQPPAPLPVGWIVSRRGLDPVLAARGAAVPTSSAPYLSTSIVPVYGRGDLVVVGPASVERCLDRPELEVILSDDGSDQETLDVLRTFTGAVVVESEVNTGFAATCNRGAAVARGQMLLFLNSDAQVAPDFFTELAAARDAHPAAGVVGARILYPNGVVQEAGGAIGWGGVGQMLSYGKDPRSPAVSRTRVVDYVSGAALSLARVDFVTVGGFQESYGRGYFEDVDLCLEVSHRLGKPTVLAGTADVMHHLSASMPLVQSEKLQQSEGNRALFVERWATELAVDPFTTIAFYLPQFHRTTENDAWWGEGFTEWTNVARARPAFQGHSQPRVPTLLGHYNLNDVAVLHEQAELARRFGVDAFCFYYYSFDGHNPLGSPLQMLLDHPEVDLTYCLSWANEPWSRNWDGGDRELLLDQPMSDDEVLLAAQGLLPHLHDPRYLRVNGAPVVLVYRPQIAPNPRRLADLFRNRLAAGGIERVHLVATESFELARTPFDVRDWGFDASAEFPPHEVGVPVAPPGAPIDGCAPITYDYDRMAALCLDRPAQGWPRYRAVAPRWDNTPRQAVRPSVFTGATPERFANWAEAALRKTRIEHGPGERLLFVNAWNEWGEGAMLEPELEHGTAFLEALQYARHVASTS